MNTTTTPLQSASLAFREGPSDKLYQAAIEPKGDGFIVTFAFGRRGSTLNTGIKTPDPVSLAEATKAFDKLVASKVAKGYRASGDSTVPYQQSGLEGRDTGIRPQLLNPIDESELERLLTGTTHCMQEKHDGRRLLVRKQGDEITGINRRGLVVAIPDPIRRAVALIPHDVLIDGEAVGDTLHAFDLLEVKGNDLRQRRYMDRHAGLLMVIPPGLPALRWVSTAVDPADKVEIFDKLRQCKREGVVFKDVNAPFSPGRPASGGPQLKHKFVESASFLVTARNAKRSVALGLYDDDRLVPAGNVTIPANHAVPAVGEVCEVRYMHAYRESGAIYQPVYVGKRCDIPANECTTDQVKYKDTGEIADKGSSVQFECSSTPDNPVLKLSATCGGMPVTTVYQPEPAVGFPVRPAVQGSITSVPKEPLLALQTVAGCASTDATRFVLNGVLFSPDDGGTLIATDGRRLACAPVRYTGLEFILPSAAVHVLGFPDFTARDGAIQQPEEGNEPHIQFRSGPHTFIARAIDGNYPNYRQVIPHEFLADATIPETQRPALISWLRSLDGKGDSVRLTWEKPGHVTLTLRESDTAGAQIAVALHCGGCTGFCRCKCHGPGRRGVKADD